jgi:hypothetical protein
LDAVVITELLKLGISTYFAIAKTAGATVEEVDKVYQAEKERFEQNTPDQLEDV